MGATELIDGQVKIWLALWTYSWFRKCGSFLELNSYTVETVQTPYIVRIECNSWLSCCHTVSMKNPHDLVSEVMSRKKTPQY